MSQPAFRTTRAALEVEVLASLGDEGVTEPKRLNSRVLTVLLRAWQADHQDERIWAYLWPTMTAYVLRRAQVPAEVDEYLQQLVLLLVPYLERADPNSPTAPGYIAKAIRCQAISVWRETPSPILAQGGQEAPDTPDVDEDRPLIEGASSTLRDLGDVCYAMADALPEHWGDTHAGLLNAVAERAGLAIGRVKTLFGHLRPTLRSLLAPP